jgi:3-oxoacyl-[acyl-carrier-protein] synthase II
VHKVVRILREANVREISPLDAPNASSNVIASTIAIWFRSGGPNLMVCSGATSGLDALALGCTLLRAGRADRVLVVGVEPDDEVAARLFRENLARLGTTGELRAGAACIVLERSTETTAGMPVLGCCRPVTGSADLASLPRSTVVIGPAEMAPAGARVIDLSRRIGDLYGALGVLQLAVGSAMTEVAPADPPSEWVLICGNRIEGWLLLPVSQDVLRIRSAAS